MGQARNIGKQLVFDDGGGGDDNARGDDSCQLPRDGMDCADGAGAEHREVQPASAMVPSTKAYDRASMTIKKTALCALSAWLMNVGISMSAHMRTFCIQHSSDFVGVREVQPDKFECCNWRCTLVGLT